MLSTRALLLLGCIVLAGLCDALSIKQPTIVAPPEPEPVELLVQPLSRRGAAKTRPLLRNAVKRGLLPRMPRLGASDDATVALLVHYSLIDKITQIATPIIEQVATSISIPAQDTNHYSFPAFHLQNFTLGAAQVQFIAPNQIQATFVSVSLVVPTTPFFVYEKIFGHKIGCHGTFAATTVNTTLQLTLDLIRSPLNGTLLVGSAAATAAFGTLNIQHTFDSDICKIAGAVIGFFFGGLNNLLKDVVEDMLPPKIAHVAQNETNGVLDASPLRLAASPNVTATGLELVAELLPSNATPPTVPQPTFDAFPPRDVEVYLTEASLNEFLAVKSAEGAFNGAKTLPSSFNTTTVGKLIPAVAAACNGCPLAIEYNAFVPPYTVVTQRSVQAAVLQFQVVLAALNATSTVDLLTVSLDLGLTLGNVSVTGRNASTIYFQLYVPTLSATLVQSAIGNVDVSLLADLAKFVLGDIVLKDFNANFKGWTLPVVAGFGAKDIVIDLTNGQIGVAVNAEVPAKV